MKNAQLLISENERLAQRTTAVLASVTAQRQWLATRTAAEPQPAGNSVYIVSFDFASTTFWLPTSEAQRLVNEARSAPFVAVRGRTDGTVDTAAERRIASQRASAVREFLVAAGIDPARIRTSYQPTGDHLADNSDAVGRALNRRVEIEIYRTAPVTTALPRPGR
ncbi:OmpA family protein [Roseateles sp. DC23W]|uniref:OmpA family protein n=1 Tax=Pelomonas dachongensis TaxID=3299029 RepID=A0ABW7EYA2_9BURK